jgi:hypothetical protein
MYNERNRTLNFKNFRKRELHGSKFNFNNNGQVSKIKLHLTFIFVFHQNLKGLTDPESICYYYPLNKKPENIRYVR